MNLLNRLPRTMAMAIATVLCGVACGCSKQTSLPETTSNTFATAKPEIQQIWKDAEACSQKNDYLGAASNLVTLQARQSELSPEQSAAVEELWAAEGNRIFAAAENGDAEAVKAMQEMRKTRTR